MRKGVSETLTVGFSGGIVTETELSAGSRFRPLIGSDAGLTFAEYVLCFNGCLPRNDLVEQKKIKNNYLVSRKYFYL